jgi:5-methylcytosine-specific restriction endonuclease McrA
LCHEYDHILPHSKGGETRLNNCQILQTKVNRQKGSSINMTNEELKKYSIKTELTNYEMDLIEKLVYGEETNKSRKKSKTKH